MFFHGNLSAEQTRSSSSRRRRRIPSVSQEEESEHCLREAGRDGGRRQVLPEPLVQLCSSAAIQQTGRTFFH